MVTIPIGDWGKLLLHRLSAIQGLGPGSLPRSQNRSPGSNGWLPSYCLRDSTALCPPPRCENCLLRFRTHRSLFKHLHVCAEHAQSPAPPPPPALDKEPPAPERPPESDPSSAPGLQFPLLEPFTTPPSASTGPFLPYLNPAPFGLSPPRLRPFLAAAPGPPTSSTAVWKKSQGECRGGRGLPKNWLGLP